MSQYTPEIEELLWSVAESNDTQTIEDFGNRYPSLRSELVSRIQLVRALKGARPDRVAPKFIINPRGVRKAVPSRLVFGLGAVAFASLVFAIVLVVQPKTTEQASGYSNQTVHIESQPLAANTNEKPTGTQGMELPGGSSPQDPPKQQEVKPTAFETPVNIDTERGYLGEVIRNICQQSGLTVEFAPGFENVTISAKYQGVGAKQALDDLGQNFGFTAIQEGEKAVLVVPTVDPNKPASPTPPGSFSEPSQLPEGESGSVDSPKISKN